MLMGRGYLPRDERQIRYASQVAVVSPLSEKVREVIAALATAANGGAVLVGQGGDVALRIGDVTREGADLIGKHGPSAASWAGHIETFSCNAGSQIHVVAIRDGWVLAVESFRSQREAAGSSPLPRAVDREMGVRFLMRHFLDTLVFWLPHRGLPMSSPPDPDRGGAPTEVFAARTPNPKRRS
jgi:hypothetical protein